MPMDGRTPPPQDDGGSPGRLAVDITVPDAQADRDGFLRSEWQRQTAEDMPVPLLRLPRRSEGAYTVRIRHTRMADLVVQDMYSDAVTWQCNWEEGITAVVPLQGASRFMVSRNAYRVGPGLVWANKNETAWECQLSRGTRGVVLVLPARDVDFPRNKQLITAEQKTPAARLLLAHLQSWAGLSGVLSPAAEWASRNATIELFHGILNDQVVDDEEFSSTLVRAATDYVESRLLDDPDLNPQSIAAALHVSVRTLHRAFTNEETSVMGYVRERRLQRARSDVVTTSLTVSEIATRWHFTDSSHFVKAYKKRFEEPPTALRHHRRQNPPPSGPADDH